MNLSKIKDFKSSKGFTLIELLIVIAIIGILAAALLVALNPAQRIAASQNARVKSDIASLGNLANLYSTDTALNTTCTAPGYPPAPGFGDTAAGCNPVIKYPLAPASPQASAPYLYNFNAGAPIIWGPSFIDGTVADTKGWCWSTALNQVTKSTHGDASNCP